MPSRSLLLSSHGTLRFPVLLVLLLGGAALVLALASLGGWPGVVAAGAVLVAAVVALVRWGDGVEGPAGGE